MHTRDKEGEQMGNMDMKNEKRKSRPVPSHHVNFNPDLEIV
jgi:hypothetical protein